MTEWVVNETSFFSGVDGFVRQSRLHRAARAAATSAPEGRWLSAQGLAYGAPLGHQTRELVGGGQFAPFRPALHVQIDHAPSHLIGSCFNSTLAKAFVVQEGVWNGGTSSPNSLTQVRELSRLPCRFTTFEIGNNAAKKCCWRESPESLIRSDRERCA